MATALDRALGQLRQLLSDGLFEEAADELSRIIVNRQETEYDYTGNALKLSGQVCSDNKEAALRFRDRGIASLIIRHVLTFEDDTSLPWEDWEDMVISSLALLLIFLRATRPDDISQWIKDLDAGKGPTDLKGWEEVRDLEDILLEPFDYDATIYSLVSQVAEKMFVSGWKYRKFQYQDIRVVLGLLLWFDWDIELFRTILINYPNLLHRVRPTARESLLTEDFLLTVVKEAPHFLDYLEGYDTIPVSLDVRLTAASRYTMAALRILKDMLQDVEIVAKWSYKAWKSSDVEKLTKLGQRIFRSGTYQQNPMALLFEKYSETASRIVSMWSGEVEPAPFSSGKTKEMLMFDVMMIQYMAEDVLERTSNPFIDFVGAEIKRQIRNDLGDASDSESLKKARTSARGKGPLRPASVVDTLVDAKLRSLCM